MAAPQQPAAGISCFVAPESLHRLRARLLTAGPGVAAEILQDAGFATGEALMDEWRNRVAARTGIEDDNHLDAVWFEPLFAEVCAAMGWGLLDVTTLSERAVLFSSADWFEAEPGATEHPGCYFTCGCLAAFLTAQAGPGAELSVLEVECRSSGAERCRFVAGSTDTLAAVYDMVAAGGDWHDAMGTAA